MGAEHSQEDILHLIELTHAAGVGDRSRFRRLWEPLRGGWPEDWRLIGDHPWLLETAAEYASAADWGEVASELYDRASELWRELGDEEAAARIE